MTTLAEIVATNPPRLVITYENVDGGERFGVRTGGSASPPMMGFIGVISRVQSDLIEGRFLPELEEMALVIAFNRGDGFSWWSNSSIPTDPLVGMLETVKAQLIAGEVMKVRGATSEKQPGSPPQLFGPDGRPMGR